ncbi:M1 family metallopeptidase [Streptomyces sp. NPDC006172]|uniref:M1 family metallopeptidase n=1 Tax=Streptomyces sp. NPDC006172 TaxID=3154470 RepID=UPI0033E7609E
MYRTVRLVRAAAAVVVVPVLALCVGACDGGGRSDAVGSSGVGDPYFPKSGNGGYDVTHYALDLAYDPATRRLAGTARITARATQRLDGFHLDLKGLEVEKVTVAGKDASFEHEGQELSVRPSGPLAEGATFETTVRYGGRPAVITDSDGSKEGWLRTADGALALGEPTGSMAWFPGNHHPSDKASYDITVTVPEGLTAVSNGELKGERTAGGRTAFSWRTAEPMASYLATVAIGRYEISRPAAGEGPSLYVAVDSTQAARGREALARLPEVLEWAAFNFGPYPFSSAGAIVDRPEDVTYALETQNRPVFAGPPEPQLLVHEIAHQWFGNSVTPRTWRDMWLNEGFATYAQWLWIEDEGGPTAEQTFQDTYDNGEEEHEDLWSFPPAAPPGAEDISAEGPVYQRGAMVIHKIRQTVGDDAFYDLVQGWTAAHRHGNAGTAQFTAYVEAQAPDKDFRPIWRDWLYGEGKPDRA